MSQHKFSRNINGQHFQVQMGWDSPLQWFYCVIIKNGDEDNPYYSNLDEENRDIYYYQYICEMGGIKLPEGIIEEILSDQNGNVTGREVNWDKNEDLN